VHLWLPCTQLAVQPTTLSTPTSLDPCRAAYHQLSSITPAPLVRRAVGNGDVYSLGKHLVCPVSASASCRLQSCQMTRVVASICFQHCEGPRSLPSPLLSSYSAPFPSSLFPLPLEVAPLIQLWGLGSTVSSHSGVWGKASAANDFGAF